MDFDKRVYIGSELGIWPHRNKRKQICYRRMCFLKACLNSAGLCERGGNQKEKTYMWWGDSFDKMEVSGIDENEMVPRQCTVGTNKMLAVSCLHSAANAEGCIKGSALLDCYEMFVWQGDGRDAIISVICIFQHAADPSIHAHAKGNVIAIHSFVKIPRAIFWVINLCAVAPPPNLAACVGEWVGYKGRLGGGGWCAEQSGGFMICYWQPH